MRPIYYAAAFALAIGSAACVGTLDPMTGDDTVDPDPDPDPEPESQSRQLFEDTVAPMLTTACAACHTGAIDAPNDFSLNFMGSTGVSGFYAAIIAEPSVNGGFNPALANLVNKGEHDGGNARAWTATEKETISAWLLSEATERGLDVDDPGTPPDPTDPTAVPKTSREALAKFSACMSINDWQNSQIYTWADKGSDRGQCMSCHNQGAGGFYASDDDNEMFEMNRYEIFITTFFTAKPLDVTDLTKGYTIAVNEPKLIAKSNAVGHPSYNATGGNQMQYLRDFYDLTMVRWNAGQCPPGGFPTTPPAQ